MSNLGPNTPENKHLSSHAGSLKSQSLASLGKGLPEKRTVGDLGATHASRVEAITRKDHTDCATGLSTHEAGLWKDLDEAPIDNTSPLVGQTQTIQELNSRNQRKPATIKPAPAVFRIHSPAPQTKKPSFWQKCKNIVASVGGTKIDPPLTNASIEQLRDKPSSDYSKNIPTSEKSPLLKKVFSPFIAAKNALATIGSKSVQEYRKPAIITAAALSVGGIFGGILYKSPSAKQSSSDTPIKYSETQDVPVPTKTPHHTNTIDPQFDTLLWEQQKTAQNETHPVSPTTLAEAPVSYQSDILIVPQTSTTPDLSEKDIAPSKPIAEPAPLPVIESASPETETPPPEAETAGVRVPDTIASPLITVGEKTPASVTENTSKTAMFVISYKGKSITIKDTNNDGITVREYRLGLFASIPGGNISRNTHLMYKMADTMGLNTKCIKPGHENDPVTLSQIMPGITPVTREYTSQDDKKTYTITANTPEALDQAIAQLTHPDKMVSAEKIQITPPLPKAETVEDVPPRAIPVPESELDALGEAPSDESPGVLPELDSQNTPPRAIPVPESEFDGGSELPPDMSPGVLPDRNSQDAQVLPIIGGMDSPADTRAMNIYEYLRNNNGVYASYSRALVPSTPKEAQEQLGAIIETWTAVNAYRVLSNQPKIGLKSFFRDHYSFCTRDKNGGEKVEGITLEKMARLAEYSDLTVAHLLEKKIPSHVIDAEDHDGSLGTFDMNGWDQTEKLIFAGAKKKHGKEPTLQDLTRFVEDNVSIEKYPGLTYTDILKKAREERAQELALKQEKSTSPPLTPPTPTVSPLKPSAKQWAWISIHKETEISDLQNAIQTIRQDFTVGREMAKKENRPFKWLTESEFANDRYQIIDEQKRIVSYGTALMKISREPESKK